MVTRDTQPGSRSHKSRLPQAINRFTKTVYRRSYGLPDKLSRRIFCRRRRRHLFPARRWCAAVSRQYLTSERIEPDPQLSDEEPGEPAVDALRWVSVRAVTDLGRLTWFHQAALPGVSARGLYHS